MMRFAKIGLVVLAIELGTLAAAHAEGRPTQLADHKPAAKDTALELELGWFTRSAGGASLNAFTPHLDIRHAFSQHAELTIDWPLEILIASGGDTGGARIDSGNPSAVLYYMDRGQNGYFRIGGGLGFPLAPDLLSVSLAMNGLRDAWSYAPKAFSFLIPGQLEIQRGALVLGGDFASALMIPTGAGRNTTQIALQIAGLIGGRVGKTTLGARLQAAWLPKDNGDNAQVALVPFVQADFYDGGFLYARLTLNLDAPYGLFSDNTQGVAKVWALFIGGGSRM